MSNSNISDKQLAANRANALKSTGPTSEEGKKKSRRNASRHHLTGQVMTMTPEEHAAYTCYLNSFIADLTPEGALENALVHSVAHGYWRLKRAEAIEENNFAVFAETHGDRVAIDYPQLESAFLQAMAFFENPHTFSLLTLYEQRIHRKTHKDLKTLMDLRAARERNLSVNRPQRAMTVGAGPLAEMVIAAETRTDSVICISQERENGFVFSNDIQPQNQPAPSAETGHEPPDLSATIPEAA